MVDSINAGMEDSLAVANFNAQRRAASEHANIDAAKSVAEINNKVQSIESGLSTERKERKTAGKENKEYTRRQTKWANIRSWISTVIAVLLFFLTVIFNWGKLLAFFKL